MNSVLSKETRHSLGGRGLSQRNAPQVGYFISLSSSERSEYCSFLCSMEVKNTITNNSSAFRFRQQVKEVFKTQNEVKEHTQMCYLQSLMQTGMQRLFKSSA